MVDTQFTDSLPYWFRIARKAKGQAVQTGRDQGARAFILESGSPLPECFCLFYFDHQSIL